MSSEGKLHIVRHARANVLASSWYPVASAAAKSAFYRTKCELMSLARNAYQGCLVVAKNEPMTAREWAQACEFRRVSDGVKVWEELLELGAFERVEIGGQTYVRVWRGREDQGSDGGKKGSSRAVDNSVDNSEIEQRSSKDPAEIKQRSCGDPTEIEQRSRAGVVDNKGLMPGNCVPFPIINRNRTVNVNINRSVTVTGTGEKSVDAGPSPGVGVGVAPAAVVGADAAAAGARHHATVRTHNYTRPADHGDDVLPVGEHDSSRIGTGFTPGLSVNRGGHAHPHTRAGPGVGATPKWLDPETRASAVAYIQRILGDWNSQRDWSRLVARVCDDEEGLRWLRVAIKEFTAELVGEHDFRSPAAVFRARVVEFVEAREANRRPK